MKIEKLGVLACLRNKDAFHTTAKAALKEIADVLELPKGSYDIRSNKAGFGVLGEVTLHGENIYVQVGDSMYGILYRTCKSRKDYSGGSNNWLAWDKADKLVDSIKKLTR
jgi:hypothetical protein